MVAQEVEAPLDPPDERPLMAVCHEYRRSKRRCATVREMKEGPSGSAISERCGKVGTMIPASTVERGERKRTADEASKAD